MLEPDVVMSLLSQVSGMKLSMIHPNQLHGAWAKPALEPANVNTKECVCKHLLNSIGNLVCKLCHSGLLLSSSLDQIHQSLDSCDGNASTSMRYNIIFKVAESSPILAKYVSTKSVLASRHEVPLL